MSDPIKLYGPDGLHPDPEKDSAQEMQAKTTDGSIEPAEVVERERPLTFLDHLRLVAHRVRAHLADTADRLRDWAPGKPRSQPRGPDKATYQAEQRARAHREAARERQHRVMDRELVASGHRSPAEIEAGARDRLQGRLERDRQARAERREVRRTVDPARRTADKLQGSHPNQQRAYLDKMRGDRPSIADRVRDFLGL